MANVVNAIRKDLRHGYVVGLLKANCYTTRNVMLKNIKDTSAQIMLNIHENTINILRSV